MGQVILRERRRLGDRLGAMEAALRGRATPDELRNRFDAIREAAERHFEQEECLYFPTIASLRPEHGSTLAKLTREHRALRRRLEDLDGTLAGGEMGRFREGLIRLAGDFGRHEDEEERMLSGIDRTIANGRRP